MYTCFHWQSKPHGWNDTANLTMAWTPSVYANVGTIFCWLTIYFGYIFGAFVCLTHTNRVVAKVNICMVLIIALCRYFSYNPKGAATPNETHFGTVAWRQSTMKKIYHVEEHWHHCFTNTDLQSSFFFFFFQFILSSASCFAFSQIIFSFSCLVMLSL